MRLHFVALFDMGNKGRDLFRLFRRQVTPAGMQGDVRTSICKPTDASQAFCLDGG
jgi:hypothetical protein